MAAPLHKSFRFSRADYISGIAQKGQAGTVRLQLRNIAFCD